MGSTLSHPSLEWALAAGLAGAAAYSYLTYTTAPSNAPSPPAVEKGTKSKKKKQTPKKGGVEKPSEKLPTTTTNTTTTTTATSPTTATVHGLVPEPTIVPFPHVIPGEFDAVFPSSDDQQVKKNKATKKTKTKKQKQQEKEKEQGPEGARDVAPERLASQLGSGDGDGDVNVSGTSKAQPSETTSPKAGSELRTAEIRTWSFDTDSSWTRIDTRQGARGAKTATGSDDQIHAISADMTSSDVGPSTGDSEITERTDEDESPSLDVGDKRRTLAERLLPRPRKTAVDE
jgi:hypothetical protein